MAAWRAGQVQFEMGTSPLAAFRSRIHVQGGRRSRINRIRPVCGSSGKAVPLDRKFVRRSFGLPEAAKGPFRSGGAFICLHPRLTFGVYCACVRPFLAVRQQTACIAACRHPHQMAFANLRSGAPPTRVTIIVISDCLVFRSSCRSHFI